MPNQRNTNSNKRDAAKKGAPHEDRETRSTKERENSKTQTNQRGRSMDR